MDFRRESYTGNILPDYIYYFDTEVDEDPSNEIQSVTKYSYINENWDTGVNLENYTEFTSSSHLRFAELKIPLADIDISSGGPLSVILFSTQEGKIGAADSIPSSDFTYDFGEQESWLTMPEPIEIIVTESVKPQIEGYPLFLLFTFLASTSIVLKNYKIHNHKEKK